MVHQRHTDGPFCSWLSALCQNHGEKQAVAGPDGSLGYRELWQISTARARALAEVGVGGDARIAVVVENSVEGILRLCAAALAAGEVLLLGPGTTRSAAAATLERFAPEWQWEQRLPYPRPVENPAWRPRATGVTLLSSGSLGVPKLVTQHWDVTVQRVDLFSSVAGLEPSDVIVTTAPVSHGYGLRASVLAGFSAGATVVLAPLPLRAETLIGSIRQSRATILHAVPFVYRMLLQGDPSAVGPLRFAMSSGEGLSAEVAEEWLDRTSVSIRQELGATETGPITFDTEGWPGTVGRPLPDVKVRLDSQTAKGGLLQACARWGTSLYDPLDSRRRIDFSDTWFATGDMVSIDARGAITILRRADHVINVGGNKVDPTEVEDALMKRPDVLDCVVRAGPAVETGQEVVAIVVPQGDVSKRDLRLHLLKTLPSYKVPRTIDFVAEIPRTATGKRRRRIGAD